jgi:hypothetical protein
MIGNSGPSDKGEVLALGKGTTTIEAIPLSPMVNPNHPEQTIRLFVTDSPIDRIEIDSPSSLIPVNYGLSLTAKAFFVDGSSLDISHLVAWSSDSILASVSEQGQLEALGIGTVNISIEFMGETDSLPLSISSASLIGIDVSPSMPMILVGEFIEFRATGTFDDGQSRDITEYVTWGSSDPREAWIDNTAEQKGECVGIMPGIVGISASSGTIFGNSQVWIN